MEKREIVFRKERSIGDVISDSFEFLKQNASTIFRIVAVYVLPFIILYAVAQVYFQRNVLSRLDFNDPEMIATNIGQFNINMLLFILFGIFTQSLLAGTYFSYLEAYVKNGRENFSISDISPKFFTNSLLALGANLLFWVIVMFGTMMFVLPGIYFANTFSLVVFIVIFEKKGLGHSLAFSWKLVNRSWWATFFINIAGLIFVFAIGIIISIPVIIAQNNGTLPSTDNIVEYPTWYWLLTGFSAVVTTSLLVIPFTFQAFQYFNLSERERPKVQGE